MELMLQLSLLGCTSCKYIISLQFVAGIAVGETRDQSKEFVYDYSYWSFDPRDAHFVSQEKV